MQHTRTWESPDPQRLARRARDADAAVRTADESVRALLVRLARAVASEHTDQQILRQVAMAAGGAHERAVDAIAAARDADAAATAQDTKRLDRLTDKAQRVAADAQMIADQALSRLP